VVDPDDMASEPLKEIIRAGEVRPTVCPFLLVSWDQTPGAWK
jgi:hypothetical protein